MSGCRQIALAKEHWHLCGGNFRDAVRQHHLIDEMCRTSADFLG
jgi:hypothetical protein